MCGCFGSNFCISVCAGHLEKNFESCYTDQPSSSRATIIRKVISRCFARRIITKPTFTHFLKHTNTYRRATRPLELNVSSLPGAIAGPSQPDSDSEFNFTRQEVNMVVHNHKYFGLCVSYEVGRKLRES